MNSSICGFDGVQSTTEHNEPAKAGIKSRLPLPRLFEVRAMNTRAGRERYRAGFGDATPPDTRPKAQVISLASRRA